MEEITLLDLINCEPSIFRNSFGYHYHRSDLDPTYLTSIGTNVLSTLDRNTQRFKDEHPIEHNLSDKQIRILLKIVAREYEDCGRKRGAILRYLRHYEEQEEAQKQGDVRLFKLLKSLDTKK